MEVVLLTLGVKTVTAGATSTSSICSSTGDLLSGSNDTDSPSTAEILVACPDLFTKKKKKKGKQKGK